MRSDRANTRRPLRVAALFAAVAGVAALTSGCSDHGPHSSRTSSTVGTAGSGAVAAATLTSSDLPLPDSTIPVANTCDGDNRSLALMWAANVAVTSWTIRMDDPDAPGGTFVHWVVDAIPPSVTHVDEGTEPTGAVRTAYGGPCPPRGSAPHHYVITVTGLRGRRVVARGTRVGLYQRR